MASTHYASTPTPSAVQTSSQNQFLALGCAQSSPAPAPDPSRYGYSNGLANPQSGQMSGLQGNGLPVLSWPQSSLSGPSDEQYGQSFDTTGQIAPSGMEPRVTATLWEDEGSSVRS